MQLHVCMNECAYLHVYNAFAIVYTCLPHCVHTLEVYTTLQKQIFFFFCVRLQWKHHMTILDYH